MIRVKFKKLIDYAIPFKYTREGDACMDMYSVEDTTIEPNSTEVVSTGIALEIPIGFEGIVRGRSGLASKGIHVHIGTIESSYRGDIEGYKKTRAQYCTLIHLESGYPAFEEPSSRLTTVDRLMKHIYEGDIISAGIRPDRKPYQESAGIKILDKNKYTIEINY